VLQPGLASHPDAVRRFSASAGGDRFANHQNIVKAFDVGMDGKEVYLVMEVVDGEDPRTVKRTGPLPPESRRAHRIRGERPRGCARRRLCASRHQTAN
jgi:serine/threonine protein kinase